MLRLEPIRRQVDYMDAHGFICHHKADPGSRGWQSFMIGDPDYMRAVANVVAEHGRPKLHRLRDPVIIRDANGQPLERDETREEGRMRRKVEEINEAMGSIVVSDAEGGNHSAYLARIANETLARGCRFYAEGGAFQSLSKEARKRITIDGEEVVELDFKTLHPAFLYAEVGHPLPIDCYDIKPWPRALVKVGLLILINAKTMRSARLAIANHAAMAALVEPGTAIAERLAENLLAAIKYVHAPIARFFHKDVGAGLMRRDSDIAEKVMLAMQRRGEVVLPIHDSFIVRASMADQLREVMFMEASQSGLRDPKIA